MKAVELGIAGVILIEPRIFGDERGYFFEAYNQEAYHQAGIEVNFIQDNESRSSYCVIRGLHFQLAPYTQAKLLRVIEGRILDVVVDLRRDSATFGKHLAVELDSESKRQLFVPRGFAHGFSVLSEHAVIGYKCDNLYAPQCERSIRPDDPELGIDWRVPYEMAILSPKDRAGKNFCDSETF